MPKRTLQGVVVSDKPAKTVVVRVGHPDHQAFACLGCRAHLLIGSPLDDDA